MVSFIPLKCNYLSHLKTLPHITVLSTPPSQILFSLRPDLNQLTLLLKNLNQAASTRIVLPNFSPTLQLALDLLRQRLPQLDTPLIERIDVPNCTFSKGKMLIKHNQGTESTGRDLLSENTSRRTIAEEGLVLHQDIGRILGFELRLVFTDHESLGLREEVGR